MVTYDGLGMSDVRNGQTDLQRFNIDALAAIELQKLDYARSPAPVRNLAEPWSTWFRPSNSPRRQTAPHHTVSCVRPPSTPGVPQPALRFSPGRTGGEQRPTGSMPRIITRLTWKRRGLRTLPARQQPHAVIRIHAQYGGHTANARCCQFLPQSSPFARPCGAVCQRHNEQLDRAASLRAGTLDLAKQSMGAPLR